MGKTKTKKNQPNANKGIKAIILGVIVALIVGIGVGIYYIYSSKTSGQTGTETKITNTGYEDPATYEEGKGIYVSHKGVGELDDKLPTLEIYMDYTCGHCVNFEKAYGKELEEAVKNGKLNVIYRPVNILRQDYSKYVSSAVIDLVTSDDKDKFLTFQYKVTGNIADFFENKDETKMTADYLDKLAKESGISDDVIAKFRKAKNDGYIDVAVQRWIKREGFEDGKIGTPTFILDGKVYTAADIQIAGGILPFVEANTK